MFMGYRYLTNSTKLRILILGDSDVKQRDIVNALVTFGPDLSHYKIIFEKNENLIAPYLICRHLICYNCLQSGADFLFTQFGKNWHII